MAQQINIINLFTKAAMEVSGKKLAGLQKDTVISKLGLDSVAIMELVGYVEEQLSIRLPDEDLAKVQTVEDLGTLVKRLVPAGTDVTW